MNNVTRTLLVLITASVLSGCVAFRITDKEGVTVPEKPEFSEELGEATGRSSTFRLLWFIPVTERMDYEDALTDALRAKGGDAIINATYRRKYRIWILGTVKIYEVKGVVVRNLDKEEPMN